MEANFTGFYEGMDEYGHIVINHNEDKLNILSFFKWTTKVIGTPTVDFIGIRQGDLVSPKDFHEGDQVTVHFKIIECQKSKVGKRLMITKMKAIG